jgi:long-chain fatty acid transport protein
MTRIVFFLFLVFLINFTVLITGSQAGVLYVPDIGTKAMGRGGAYIANPADLSALYFNPAGLAAQDKNNQFLTMLYISSTNSWFQRATDGEVSFDEVESSPVPLPAPAFMGSWCYPDHPLLKRFVFAAGFFTPHGYLLQFPQDGAQRYTNYYTMMLQASQVVAVGVKITDSIRFGFDIGNVMMGIDNKSMLPSLLPGADGLAYENTDMDIIAHVSAYDWFNFYYNLGLSVDLTSYLTFGFSFSPPLHGTLVGSLTGALPPTYQEVLGFDSISGNAHIPMNLPYILRGGLSVRPIENLEVEMAMVIENWSDFTEEYVNLDSPLLIEDNPLGVYKDQVIPMSVGINWGIRVGAEYRINSFDLRAGYLYESDTSEDDAYTTFLLDSNKRGYSAGFTYNFEKWNFDFSFVHLKYGDRTVNDGIVTKTGVDYSLDSPVINNGLYKINVETLNLGLGYKF